MSIPLIAGSLVVVFGVLPSTLSASRGHVFEPMVATSCAVVVRGGTRCRRGSFISKLSTVRFGPTTTTKKRRSHLTTSFVPNYTEPHAKTAYCKIALPCSLRQLGGGTETLIDQHNRTQKDRTQFVAQARRRAIR